MDSSPARQNGGIFGGPVVFESEGDCEVRTAIGGPHVTYFIHN